MSRVWDRSSENARRWDEGSGEHSVPEMEEFGCRLENELLSLYARGFLSAKGVCTICWLAQKAGAHGEGLHRIAFDPESDSGSFNRHLQRVLPVSSTAELDIVTVPSFIKNRRQD